MTDIIVDLNSKLSGGTLLASALGTSASEQQNVIEVDVSENNLQDITVAFALLPRLKTLNAATNKLQTLLPDSSSSPSPLACVQLASLALENNLLTTLPKSFAQLANVRRLTLQNNLLKKLPSALFALHGLTHLDLSENELSDGDAWSSFASLVHLATLMLDANELKSIPAGLFQLRALVKLSLKHNYITNVPSGVAGLESLQELFLNDNKITKVPVHVYRLPKLRWFARQTVVCVL